MQHLEETFASILVVFGITRERIGDVVSIGVIRQTVELVLIAG
jgi:hypothetical protein